MTVDRRRRFATPPDVRVARKADQQHGRIRIDQLRECGLDEAAVRRRVVKGWLHRVHTGVYAVGHTGGGMHADIMAAVLAGGQGAVASHWASAALHGFVRWDERRVDVSVTGTGGRSRPGIRFHRPRRLDQRDTTTVEGIRTTTAARALLEIAPQLTDRHLKRAVRQAQAERAANVGQIADVLRRAGGHRATKRLAAVIATGPAPTASGNEDVVLDLLLDAGFAHPQVNPRLQIAGGATYHPDFHWPAQRLILEVDSAWHDGPLNGELDAERQADLEAAGERVLRTTLEQAVLGPARLVRRLRAAGAPYTDAQP